MFAPLIAFFGAVLTWAGSQIVTVGGFAIGLFSAQTAREILKFTAWKGFLMTMALVVYPSVVMIMSLKMLQKGYALLQTYFAESTIGGLSVFEFTGLSGWLFSQMRLGEAFALIFSAIAFRITLSLIPKLGQMKLGL